MRTALTLLTASLFALAGSGTAFSSTIYALSSSNPGGLYTINPTTGAATLFANLSNISSGSDLDFLNGTLYATDIFSNSFYSFGTLDKTQTPVPFTKLNNQGGNSWTGLAAIPKDNKLYGVIFDTNNLISITPAGVATIVGYGLPTLIDLAYDANHDILYGIGYSSLYTINRATGTATSIWSLGAAGGSSSLGLGYDNSSNLLFLNNGDLKQLFTINPATGAVTLVGDNNTGVVLDGITVLADLTGVPEPTTMAMLGGGLILFVRLWKVRRDLRARFRA